MNLAKLFKLPKKLGDSLLISLINNMVDYLLNYDSAIKVDDDGYIHLAADELYLDGNNNDIDIEVDNHLYLNVDGEIHLESLNVNGIYLSSSDNIYLDADNNIYLNTYNECDIELTSDGGIRLNTNNSDIELIADRSINLTSNGGDINLSTMNEEAITLSVNDEASRLILWYDNDGLQYKYSDETYFQIKGDGKIYGKTLENEITVNVTNNSGNYHEFLLQCYNEEFYEDITIETTQEASSDWSIEYPNYNPNGYIKISVNGSGFKGDIDIVCNGHTITYRMNNQSVSDFVIPVNFRTLETISIELDDDYCYTADTIITLADGSTKQVKDITYDDELKVWNFDEGKDDVAKPLWIKRTEYAKSYQLVTLSDGNTIKLCGSDGKYHCMFDVTEQKFNHAVDCIGHEVYTENGITTVVSIEEVKEKVDHYNIVTNYHMNLYANHILTSTEKNNIYPIADMKFVKDDRKIVPYEEFEKAHISHEYYDGWRAGEWNEPLKDVITHLRRRKMYAKSQKRVKDVLHTDYFG